jgi:hypothetical protein
MMGRESKPTGGDWRVPTGLRGVEREASGVVVVTGPEESMELIADCRNRRLPIGQQRANALLCAQAPAMRAALRRIELEVGDMPSGEMVSRLYGVVTDAMRRAGVEHIGSEDQD